MDRAEIVRRAVEFGSPPRLPFWQHWSHKLPEFPDDVCNIWEMDRAEAGWFFDRPGMDDWGCGWSTTEQKNIGQVTVCPLADWAALDRYRPPDPGIRPLGADFQIIARIRVDRWDTLGSAARN